MILGSFAAGKNLQSFNKSYFAKVKSKAAFNILINCTRATSLIYDIQSPPPLQFYKLLKINDFLISWKKKVATSMGYEKHKGINDLYDNFKVLVISELIELFYLW